MKLPLACLAAASALAAVGLLAPAALAAGGPTMTVVDVPLHGERALAAAAPVRRFELVGLHWRGRGTVSFRTHRLGGAWSAWRVAAPEAEDLPDAGSVEARRGRGWRLGNPWWVGASDRIEYRLRGEVTRLRAYLVRSPVEQPATRTLAVAGSPPIVPRAGWSADESIRRSPPQYADALRFAVVHHTAGANDYTRAEAPAVVRGIELYHVKANGWNDIGYNFLVDRFGTVYEGRYGGVDRNVVGAHALGFNTGSVGVAVLGTYTSAAPSDAALASLAKLLAWRLDLAHVDPLGGVSVISGGSERFPAGIPVLLRTISGHRDTGLTECPGDALYARLNALAVRAQGIGLPKIYEPAVSGALGGTVRFQARLSAALPWSVSVADASGTVVAGWEGTGPTVDWTWDASLATPGTYRWEISVDGATPASGTIGGVAGGAQQLAIRGAAADPETISPNGDGDADAATVTYTTSAAASVTVTVLDANGQELQVLQPATSLPAGTHTVSFAGEGLPDGRYTLRIDASAGGRTVSRAVDVLVTRALGGVAVSPAVFSPNGDGRADRLTVRFTLASPALVRVRVLRDGAWVATPFAGELQPGIRLVRWDGSKRLGRLLDGVYTAVVEATDEVGTSVVSLPFVSDTRAPAVAFVPGHPLQVRVSEPGTLSIRVSGRALRLLVQGPGVVRIPWRGRAGRVRVVAWDAAGNASRPLLRA
ncbi:MAG TPA: FlgD immunoglobulin-like domain containing protein [Gaiellaceae bacterium]|nr:FlgD immunoglobulin-like domain containing protein [Gaiellaceae bacterium]